ncbi:MAG: DUF3293 domain-containing protein [Saprospiraceae bacterium]|nr:DUF3293 domain-containing protein [Saprospiraceae bacterium]MCB0623023.1 DUF3293 domain-containing protein [Saprospiraceae bacterium]MCB0680043.1 DUF3293 domain-containing protein [Saprospiraceae bacterium]
MDDSYRPIDERLLEAFRQTTYRIFDPPVEIRIGQPNAELDALLLRLSRQNWFFITAWNPGARPLSEADNRRRQRTLLDGLRREDWTVLSGESVADAGDWPPEPSYWVAGAGREAAIAWGRKFGQAAVVFGTLYRRPELLWLQ